MDGWSIVDDRSPPPPPPHHRTHPPTTTYMYTARRLSPLEALPDALLQHITSLLPVLPDLLALASAAPGLSIARGGLWRNLARQHGWVGASSTAACVVPCVGPCSRPHPTNTQTHAFVHTGSARTTAAATAPGPGPLPPLPGSPGGARGGWRGRCVPATARPSSGPTPPRPSRCGVIVFYAPANATRNRLCVCFGMDRSIPSNNRPTDSHIYLSIYLSI